MAVYDKKEDKPRSPALNSKDLSKREESAGADGLSQDEYPHPESDAVDNFFKRDDLVNPSNPEADKHNASVGGLKGKLVKFGSKKILAGGIGAGLVGIFIVIGSFLGFLNVFKLNHIMQNIEARAFSRYQVALDGRSDKWIKSYILLRLSEIDGLSGVDTKDKNLLFKANKVDTNNPLLDWYKTLRTSSFEADLKAKYGIEFTSIAQRSADGNSIIFRSGMIQGKGFDNISINTLADGYDDGSGNKIKSMPLSEISDLSNSKYSNLLTKIDEISKVDVFQDNATARQVIKKVVNEDTHSWQVIKRRHVRKWIQNKTGVRSWRFFDKTRTKVEEKVISVRNKIIKAMLPDDTVMSRIVQCIFGITACRASTDSANPDTNAKGNSNTGDPKTEDKNLVDNQGNPVLDENGNPKTLSQAAKEGNFSANNTADNIKASGADIELGKGELRVVKFAEKLVKAMPYIGIIGAVETLNAINTAFENHSITKMISVARGVQAIGLYQVYQTAADQLKTGEVTGEEVNDLMQTLDTASNSEGWTSVISNSSETAQAEGEVKLATNKEEYCSDEHQETILLNPDAYKDEFAYLCDDKKIGGDNLGGSIETWWNNSIGKILGPFLDVYNNSWLPFKYIGKAVTVIGDAFGKVLMDGIKLILPGAAEKSAEEAMGWVVAKIAVGVGAGPIMDGNESGAVYANVMIEGAAYSAETSARNSGASITNDVSKALSTQMTMAYYDDHYDSESMFEKYLSLNNPESSLSNSLFATIQDTTVNNFAGIFSQIIKSAAKLPFNIFSKQTNAGTESAFAAANFAGIETYDFPTECYNLDPLTMTPQDATNADDPGIDIIPSSELTWDIVNNSDAFYVLLYQKLRDKYGDETDVDDYAKPIYDCAIMDTTIRGGLGYVYGYTNDYGLQTSNSTATSTVTNVNIDYTDAGANIPCADGVAGTLTDGWHDGSSVKIRLCDVNGITVNSQISGNVDALLKAAALNGISLGGSSYRTHTDQAAAYARYQACLSTGNGGCTPAAAPGYGNHEMGLAIDFTYNGATIKCTGGIASKYCINSKENAGFNWLYDNAGTYGLKSLSSEAWHWSVNGH